MLLTLQTFKEQVFGLEFVKVDRVDDEDGVAEHVAKHCADDESFTSVLVRPGPGEKGENAGGNGLDHAVNMAKREPFKEKDESFINPKCSQQS